MAAHICIKWHVACLHGIADLPYYVFFSQIYFRGAREPNFETRLHSYNSLEKTVFRKRSRKSVKN